MRKVECRPSAGPNSSSSNSSSSAVERGARLLVEGRGAWAGQQRPAAARAVVHRRALRPGQHQALARARHRDVQQPAHLGVVGLAVAALRQPLLEQLVGHAVGGAAPGAGHARRRQPEHEDVVELQALGRVHRHHAHRRRGTGGGRLLLAQAGLRDRGQVARELARGRLRLAAHVGGRQLGQLGDVAQPLDGVGMGGEDLLAAQADALDQPQHEGVRPAVLEGVRGRAVEAQERLGAVAPLGRQLRSLERRHGRRRACRACAGGRAGSGARRPPSAARSAGARARARRRPSRAGRPARAARRARRAPRRAGSTRPSRSAGTARPAPRARSRSPAPSLFTERTSTQTSLAGTPSPTTSRSASAATACAWARSERQCQKRTLPLPRPRSCLSRRSGHGSDHGRAAARMRAPER